MTEDVELVRRGFEAVVCRDLETVRRMLDPTVSWRGVDDATNEDGCHNREEALAFIRQAVEQGVVIDLLYVRAAGDRVLVALKTSGGDMGDDAEVEPHGELVTVRDGKIVEILVFASLESALSAAGA